MNVSERRPRFNCESIKQVRTHLTNNFEKALFGNSTEEGHRVVAITKTRFCKIIPHIKQKHCYGALNVAGKLSSNRQIYGRMKSSRVHLICLLEAAK